MYSLDNKILTVNNKPFYGCGIQPLIVGTLSPTAAYKCNNTDSGTMTLTGYQGTIVKWQYSMNYGATWTDIANTAPTYNRTVTTGFWAFRVYLTNGVDFDYSNTVYVNCYTGGWVTMDKTSPQPLGQSVTNTLNYYSNFTIQRWFYRRNGGSWVSTGIVTPTYTYTATTTGTYQFRARIISFAVTGCSVSVYSNITEIVIT